MLLLGVVVWLGGCTRDPKVLAKKYVETGNKYYEKSKYKEASLMYRKALQKDLRYGPAYYHLGLTQLKQGQGGDARRSFMRATDLDPANLDAFVRLADVDLAGYLYDPQTNKVGLDDARDLVKTILKRDPKSFDGLRIAGFVALSDKDVKTAILRFQQANESKPNQPEVAVALVQAMFGDKQDAEAERLTKSFIERLKTYGPLYDSLYGYYARTNRVVDAEQVLRLKVDNNPTNSLFFTQLAFHYYLTHRSNDMNATIGRMTSDLKKIPEAHMAAGDFFMQIRDYGRAFDEYQQGEKTADSKIKLSYGKHEVEALNRQGKGSDATNLLSTLLKSYPKDTELITMHAASLLQVRDAKKAQIAIDELQPLVAATPTDQKDLLVELHFNLGRAYMIKVDTQSLEQARLQFQEALRIKPTYLPAKSLLAELLLNVGEFPKAVQAADEILKVVPKDANARLIRTMSLIRMGERDTARTELTAMLAQNPKSNDARYQIALMDFIEKRYKDAEGNFSTLRAASDPRGYGGLLECKMAQKDFTGATELVEDQLKQNPQQPELLRQLAEIKLQTGNADDAAIQYQQVVQKTPSEGSYMRLGEIQRQAGRLDLALASFQKAKELNPADPTPVLEIAVTYDASGRADQARKGYEEVLKMQPDNGVALNNLAYAKADQGVDLDQALTFAERARQKRPNDPDVTDTIGLIYLRKNLNDESIRVLREIVSRMPTNAMYHVHYAMALMQKGDRTAARTELDAAAKYSVTDKEKARVRELRTKIS